MIGCRWIGPTTFVWGEGMREFDRRTVLRYSGIAAASMMLGGERFAFGEDAPMATTTGGRISGKVENGINVFRGIPYGEDTRKTRFKAPLPVTAWCGVKECVEWSTRTPQLTVDRGGGGERGLAVCDEKHRDEPFVPQVQPWEESG